MEWGVRGRLKRFNDTNEIPGLKIEYTEFADDKNDPATALTETPTSRDRGRRLRDRRRLLPVQPG